MEPTTSLKYKERYETCSTNIVHQRLDCRRSHVRDPWHLGIRGRRVRAPTQHAITEQNVCRDLVRDVFFHRVRVQRKHCGQRVT